ncbi:hypothetical protein [Rhizobium favelukesii]|uniref:Uncharacterized protein n=1 Tax=Rhizobium favelukesii TaxID=348824 RepID=W6R7B9_9HYPH|nr:hypothetical protein [Rhizobium favelukesii]MCS0460840.1 hypothetical protein [Rhizobium favelukesii]CDM57182.1 hypothetical protein LPU83_1510 [Rhizobium favelukesii]
MNKLLLLRNEKRTVYTSSGQGDLGVVTAEISALIDKNEGPIKLLNGVEGAKGGFGAAHIEARRLKHLTGLGYHSVVAYVHFVVSNYDRIAAQDDGRLIFLREHNNYHHRVIAQWDPELAIWSVTTALPTTSARNLDIVWTRTGG